MRGDEETGITLVSWPGEHIIPVFPHLLQLCVVALRLERGLKPFTDLALVIADGLNLGEVAVKSDKVISARRLACKVVDYGVLSNGIVDEWDVRRSREGRDGS